MRSRVSTREKDVEEGWITLGEKGQTMRVIKQFK
jgi:hypothetical protein